MRRLLWISMVFFLLASIGSAADMVIGIWNPGRIELEVRSAVGCGEIFTVVVKGVNLRFIAGFQMEVEFTAGMMEALSVDYGNLDFANRRAPAYCMDPELDNAAGRVTKIASVRLDGGWSSGTGRLLTVNFRALRPGVGRIRGARILLSDVFGRQSLLAVCEARISIEKWPPWDVNCDGRVDVSDLVYVARWYLGNCMFPANADVNRDGVVNLLDLILVGKHFGEVYNTNVQYRQAPSKGKVHERVVLEQLHKLMLEGGVGGLALQAVEGILDGFRVGVQLTTWGRLRKG